jgi:hypothetical protein
LCVGIQHLVFTQNKIGVVYKKVDNCGFCATINILLGDPSVATSLLPRTPAKTNYLNNRDILKQIHLSKNTYCSYTDPVADHQYDIILPSLAKINQRTVAEARRNRADRLKREGIIVDPKKIANTDLVFRITCWEHIPMAPKKVSKNAAKKKKIEDIFELELAEEDDPLAELIDIPVLDPKHVRLNFPPFYHYRIDENKQPFQVGKSHWIGDFETGEFSKDHGQVTRKLATMYMKLCERYATRSNWRGYTYNEEMRGQALLQLSQIGLQFDESKSQNPFAYYTAAITNSFTRILESRKEKSKHSRRHVRTERTQSFVDKTERWQEKSKFKFCSY